MTEREDVEHYRAVAAAYIAEFEAGERANITNAEMAAIAAINAIWSNAKNHLSPWTMVELCDAWLAQQSAHEEET